MCVCVYIYIYQRNAHNVLISRIVHECVHRYTELLLYILPRVTVPAPHTCTHTQTDAHTRAHIHTQHRFESSRETVDE